jgi:two-component system cell cycle sensor histidine kinase/response regulator CckA
MTSDMPIRDVPLVREPTILIIDDDPVNLSIVTNYLEEYKYTILVAEDGEIGAARAGYARPDLILLDIMMPGVDGYETCRRLKAQEATRDIPVIFMTALAETEHKVRGFEAGAVDYITKPFQREEVLARVGVHLRIRELTTRLQEAKETLEKRVAERTAELQLANGELQAEIIERRQAEEERARLATAIEQAAESIFITDANWFIYYVNPAFERMNGYSKNEIIGQHTRILKNNKHDRAFYKSILKTLKQGDVWSGRLTNRKKDGTFYEAEVTASPIRDKNGAIINYVSIHRDITNEIKLERELRQAQKMEAIGTLAAGIAHDFNNILTAILGFTQMALNKTPEDNPVQRDLIRVLESSSRAAELVRQILTFSRQSELERKPVQVSLVVNEVLKLLRSSLPATIDISQDNELGKGRDKILADPTQLHQVLMNLGTNAAHAMRANGGILGVSLSEIEADASFVSRYPDLSPGPYVRLAVSDTGHGMDAAVVERIFDPYFTTKEVGEGTGMGLAVVQGIVKSHGGAITVYSEPGQGTSFHVFLPIIRDEIVPEAKSPELLLNGSERILFVDDERPLAELGKEMLEFLGYSVTSATNSLDALKIFSATPSEFDLVVTDMTMPGLTGKKLAREITAVRGNIPIILCTGFSESINRKQAREIGIRDILMKPYVLNSLATTVRKVLDKHNGNHMT